MTLEEVDRRIREVTALLAELESGLASGVLSEDPRAQRAIALLRLDLTALGVLRHRREALLLRARAHAGPGPERDALMAWKPRRRDRPRCGAPTAKGPCKAAVVCERDLAGRVVMADRCVRHGGRVPL